MTNKEVIAILAVMKDEVFRAIGRTAGVATVPRLVDKLQALEKAIEVMEKEATP